MGQEVNQGPAGSVHRDPLGLPIRDFLTQHMSEKRMVTFGGSLPSVTSLHWGADGGPGGQGKHCLRVSGEAVTAFIVPSALLFL